MKFKKKVLFFYSDLGDGGIQRLLSVLSRELSSEYDFYIALYVPKQLFAFNGTVIQLNAPSTKNIIKLFRNSYIRMKMLASIVDEYQIDIVISHSLIENSLAVLSKSLFKFKAPLIITFHTDFKLMIKEMGLRGMLCKLIIKYFADNASGILGVSDGIINELADFGLDKSKLKRIYNPIQVDEIKLLKNEKIDEKHQKFFNKTPVIIAAGRLVPAKNYPLLIRAFLNVKKFLDCKLVILGEGKEKAKLLSLCEKYDLQNSVFLLGWVRNPYKYIAASSLCVLSSEREGFGNVLIEAMLCGKPVVATDCNHGPREIIEHGKSGLLVAINDELALADAIIALLTDKTLYKKISRNSLDRADLFSITKIKHEYISYINSFFEDSTLKQ